MGWARKCPLVIQSSAVTGTSHADFPVLLTAACLPSEMFDSDGSFPAKSDGSDLRFTRYEDGGEELPHEVVEFTTDPTPANGTAQIWVKVPTVSGSVNTTIWVWYGNAGGQAHTVTGPAGRDAVWLDYLAVWHLNTSGYVDSTGNGYTGTATGSGNALVQTTTDNPWGQTWTQFDNPDGTSTIKYLTIPITTETDSSYLTVQTMWKRDGNSPGPGELGVVIGNSGATRSNYWEIAEDSTGTEYWRGNLHDGTGENSGRLTSPTPDTSTVYYAWLTTDASSTKLHLNGSVGTDSTISSDNQITNVNTEAYIGVANPAGLYCIDGKIGHSRIYLGTRSDDWVDTEHNMMSSPATFTVEGTPESVDTARPNLRLLWEGSGFPRTFTQPSTPVTMTRQGTAIDTGHLSGANNWPTLQRTATGYSDADINGIPDINSIDYTGGTVLMLINPDAWPIASSGVNYFFRWISNRGSQWGALQVSRTDGPGALYAALNYNNDGSWNGCSTTWPTNPSWLLIRADPDNGTNTERLKIKVWEFGADPPGTWIDSTGDVGGAAATATTFYPPNDLNLLNRDESDAAFGLGPVLVLPDPDADITPFLESNTSFTWPGANNDPVPQEWQFQVDPSNTLPLQDGSGNVKRGAASAWAVYNPYIITDYIKGEWRPTGASLEESHRLYLRYDPVGDNGYALRPTNDNAFFSVRKITAGSDASIGTLTIVGTFDFQVDSPTVEFWIVDNAGTLEFYASVNGVNCSNNGAVTDASSPWGPGYGGMGSSWIAEADSKWGPVYLAQATGPTITNITDGTDRIFEDAQTGITITGTGFGT